MDVANKGQVAANHRVPLHQHLPAFTDMHQLSEVLDFKYILLLRSSKERRINRPYALERS